MTEKAARELFDKLAAELMLPTGWTFKFDTSKRRFGCCQYRVRRVDGRLVQAGPGRISLSRTLVALNDEVQVGNCIRHEIAHALVGPGHGHDATWRAMAIKCGDDGKRCYETEENGGAVKTPEAPLVGTCPRCNKTFKKFRLPNSARWCRCTGRTFNPADAIVWKATPTSRIGGATPVAMAVSTKSVAVDEAKIAAVLALRAQGMGYVAIDAEFGIFGKKGWWSWKIVKENRV